MCPFLVHVKDLLYSTWNLQICVCLWCSVWNYLLTFAQSSSVFVLVSPCQTFSLRLFQSRQALKPNWERRLPTLLELQCCWASLSILRSLAVCWQRLVSFCVAQGLFFPNAIAVVMLLRRIWFTWFCLVPTLWGGTLHAAFTAICFNITQFFPGSSYALYRFSLTVNECFHKTLKNTIYGQNDAVSTFLNISTEDTSDFTTELSKRFGNCSSKYQRRGNVLESKVIWGQSSEKNN
jgi:hypothetical protein